MGTLAITDGSMKLSSIGITGYIGIIGIIGSGPTGPTGSEGCYGPVGATVEVSFLPKPPDGKVKLNDPPQKIPNPHKIPKTTANNPINPTNTQQHGEQNVFLTVGSSSGAKFR